LHLTSRALIWRKQNSSHQNEFRGPRISGKTRPTKDVTRTVDDGVPEWARVETARGGSSVSRTVGRMLSEAVHQEHADALDDLRTSPCDARLAQERSP